MGKPQIQLIVVYVLVAIGVVGFVVAYRSPGTIESTTAGTILSEDGEPIEFIDPKALQAHRERVEDARAYVRQGLMSRQQYFDYTGEAY